MSATKRIAISCLLLVALIAIPLTGCHKSTPPVGKTPLDKWGAINMLVTEIIPPAASDARISAFMPSEALEKGDLVTSEGGANYPIDDSTWFIFIDDNPQAFYAHPTRYVFIDAKTGSYDIVDEDWPPLINNFSMWDVQNTGRGHLIELWSVLDFPRTTSGSATTAPSGDYGDAPDGQDAYPGVGGHYPTLFNTTNSEFERPGGYVLNIGEETLGFNVSAEADATDPNDPDGVPNLVDADNDERIYIITEQNQARLAFTVAVSASVPPDTTHYANALIDFDKSGNWSSGAAGAEWVTVNLEVSVKPGTSDTVMTPLFDWGRQTPLVSGVWMRLALTRAKIEESQFANVGGWDGSGQFEYGEIEDYLVFLTDNPPTTSDGDGNGDDNGEPPPPGPKKGPCGEDINYYSIIINCGDCAKHIAQGTPIAQLAASSMTSIASAQGYTSIANLGPGDNSLTRLGEAFYDLSQAVKCSDQVLIYICGHGYSDRKLKGGGIQIYDRAGGKTNEILKPGNLANLLSKIPLCPDEDCETPGKCCHVSAIIESCYAGNFKTPGVTGGGRAVVGTSTDTPSLATPDGGVYTAGLVKSLKDPDADKNDPPDGVDPMEANASASAAVAQNNKQTGGSQQPWSDNQWCDCDCPCKVGIDVEKWVRQETQEEWVKEKEWVDEIEVWPDQVIIFKLELTNSSQCYNLIDPEIVDILPNHLEYAGEAVLYVGDEIYAREPGDINQGSRGLKLSWNLMEIKALEPGESIVIEYKAIAKELGENENAVSASAHSDYDYNIYVTDQDSTSIRVSMPQSEDVLQIHLEGYSNCYYVDKNCQYCLVTIRFNVRDLTGGLLPITSIALNVNGKPLVSLKNISTEFYEDVIEVKASCGEDITAELTAIDSLGLEASLTKTGNTAEGELE